ncbi:MAG: 1-acyl-sn-glycerol-3-phosphate acyltransferase [Firmicutes bacterium]|nr:1-acyl-sn-glycerol-3-phosphate acyltransferase [Bacillota bacterium]
MNRGEERNYWLAVGILRFICRLNGTKVIGAENIPADEPLLVISNHTSLADPPVISSFYPGRITYIAKEGFSRNPFTRRLFSALGAVFLSKDDGDLAAMRVALNELKSGHSVGVFPEGHRYFDQQLGEFHDGAAFIACRAKVRVLPVAVVNTADYLRLRRRNIRLVIGEPLPAPEGRPDRELLARTTARYREIIAGLFRQGAESVQADGRKMYVTDRVRND